MIAEECGSSGLFRVLDPTVPSEYREWVSIWERSAHREVQSHPGYGIAMTPESEQLLAAVALVEGGSVVLPFAVRSIPISTVHPHRDSITPYGYGGAYLSGVVDPDWFWGCWDRWARTNGLVGITVRSHLFENEVLPLVGETANPLASVVIDLDQNHDEVWSGYQGRVRTDIRRGRRLGIEVSVDEGCKNIEEFHQIYLETMRAKEADDFYFFDLSRLERMVSSLGESVVLFSRAPERSVGRFGNAACGGQEFLLLPLWR